MLEQWDDREALAVTGTRIAVLYDRLFAGSTPYTLWSRADVYLAQFDPATGSMLSNTRLVGDCYLGTTQGCTNGAAFSRSSLVWNGSNFIAYFGIYHNWGTTKGIHEGDTLRYISPTGAQVAIGWVWGCSHSYEQRLALGTELGAVCEGDAAISTFAMWAPSTSIVSQTLGLPTDLGAIIAASDSFWVIYGAEPAGHTAENIALARFQGGTLLSNTWLTGIPSFMPRLAPFEGGLLAGWATTQALATREYVVQPLDSSGAPTAVASPVSMPFGSDFIAYPNGDIGWVYGASPGQTVPGYASQLNLVRLRRCQ